MVQQQCKLSGLLFIPLVSRVSVTYSFYLRGHHGSSQSRHFAHIPASRKERGAKKEKEKKTRFYSIGQNLIT